MADPGVDPHPPTPAPRNLPLATASVVVSALGFGPVLVLGGLIGAPMGAVAARRIAAEPARWGGLPRARLGVVLGLVSGAVPATIVCLVGASDWGYVPLGFVALYVAGVALMAVGRGSGGRAVAGGVGGVLLGAVVAIGGAFAVIWLIATVIGEVIGEIFGG